MKFLRSRCDHHLKSVVVNAESFPSLNFREDLNRFSVMLDFYKPHTSLTANSIHRRGESPRRRSLKITVRSLSFSQILRSQRYPAAPSCLVINASLYRCVILNCASPLCKVSLPTFHHLFVVIPFILPTCSNNNTSLATTSAVAAAALEIDPIRICCTVKFLRVGYTPHVVILMSTLTYFPFQPKAAQRTSQLELIRWTEQRSNLNKHTV